MMMNREEAEWIKSEYRDCPLYAVVDKFVKGVSCIEGMPAEHPSLLFYLAVYALDDIRFIGNTERRLEKCNDLRNDVVFYMKNNGYANAKFLAAEVIYCVRYSLKALSFMRCLKEISIMSEHINELISDEKTKKEIREIARKCFSCEEFDRWIESYYDGRGDISDTITSKVKEMRKANPPKEEGNKCNQGKGRRNNELFSDKVKMKEMQDELISLFNKRGLCKTKIKVTKNSKELECLLDFYLIICEKNNINYANSRGYIRFLKDAGFSFATNDENVEIKFRTSITKLLENWKKRGE